MKLVPTAQGRTAPGKTAWNPGQLESTVLGCLPEKVLTDTGRGGGLPDRPAEWVTLTHQLRYHDDYPPLARPLPLHMRGSPASTCFRSPERRRKGAPHPLHEPGAGYALQSHEPHR